MKSSMIIHPDELSRKWIDRLADSGISALGIHPTGGKTAHQSLAALLELMKTEEYRSLIDYARERGLEVEYEIHSAGYLMPRELFSEHPEYFRMNADGERVNDCNFCVSSREALDLFARRAASLALSLYGSSGRFYFWMDDGHELQCHCPRCRELSASDQQMTALNRALKAIREHVPDARMAYLAYMDTVVPPTVKPHDGIFLEYAPFEKYTAKGENAPMLIEREKRMVAPLVSLFDKDSRKVLEYWYDNSLYSHWKKPPARFVFNREQMQMDIAEYAAMGFESVSTFACFLGKDYEELYGDVDITPFSECITRIYQAEHSEGIST